MIKGYVVNTGNLSQGTLGYLFDIDGDFIADCGTDKRAKRVQYLLKEGKVSLDVVIEIFGNTGGKKRRTANKAELDEFNWDDVPVYGGESDEDVDGHGNGDIKIQPTNYALHHTHL